MADAKYRFCLTDDEKRELNQMVSSGKRNARQVLDALILLNCDESEGKKQSDEIIGGFLKVGKLRVHRVRKRFFENGMSGEVLRRAGIDPLCKVLKADGTPFLDAELDIMSDRQGNRYVLVISKEENPTEVKLELPSDKYARDIRGAGTRLADSNPIFVALLPAGEKAPVSLNVQGAGREFELAVDAGCKRDTVIRLTVTAPDGKEVWYYNANLNAPLGKARHKLQFALNDLPGEWKVRAREIVSGREAEAVLRVE